MRFDNSLTTFSFLSEGSLYTVLSPLNYGDVLPDLWYDRDYFLTYRKGTEHVSRAISSGLRGTELVPALLKDCQSWVFTRPDV